MENRETWETNRKKILEIISTKKLSYTDIILKSHMGSTATLNHLNQLIQDKLIDNLREGRNSYYVLTKKGKETINKIIREHQEYLGGLKDIGDTYLSLRSELGITMAICRLPWGIVPHLAINKKLNHLKLLNIKDIEEIEKIIYKRLTENIKNIREHQTKFKDNAMELLEKEKFVLSFNVDLHELHESIEKKSLETFEEMPEEEVTARFNAELEMMENIDDSVFEK